jgi:hypothetical protein
MVRGISAFVDFCYLVRRSVISEDTLLAVQDALTRFHLEREIFREVGVRPEGFSLPRQHSLKHYIRLIQKFGAPNGLCSSITENKHIKAVKEPWRRSSKYQALGQMLLINQRLDKLAAARVDFAVRGMLNGAPIPAPFPQPDDTWEDDEEVSAVAEAAAVDGPTRIGEVKLAKCYGMGCI